MPGKLRESRSRNVTKSNNRPASKQSRKRKTPKNNVSKGKARKTTRRRVKRGGASAIDTKLDNFFGEVMFAFLSELSVAKYETLTNSKADVVVGMPNLDFIKTLKEAFNVKNIKGTQSQKIETGKHIWRQEGAPTHTERQDDITAKKNRCSDIYHTLIRAFDRVYSDLDNKTGLDLEPTEEQKKEDPTLIINYDKLNDLIKKKYKLTFPIFQKNIHGLCGIK